MTRTLTRNTNESVQLPWETGSKERTYVWDNNNDTEISGSPISPCSSTSPISPVVKTQKEQILTSRAALSETVPESEQSFPIIPSTSTTIVPSSSTCNMPSNNLPENTNIPIISTSITNSVTNSIGDIQNAAISQNPDRVVTRERRQRGNEGRRDGNGRRKPGRTRNHVHGGVPIFSDGTSQNNSPSGIKMDLPTGYELRTTQQGQVYFFHIPTGVSTWHDPRIPKDLTPLSLDLDHLGPLPPGWEMRQTSSGRIYFVDLNIEQ
ncbi:hypothetical protein JTB14_021334 [Gonioctena quinquepunctata]|nr:hypothetical protein JTB14_021334 [Gonioctena quinquepunctata]